MATRAKAVAFLQATDGMFSYRRQAGAQQIAVASGWLMHTIRYSMTKDGGYRLHRPRGCRTVADLATQRKIDPAIAALWKLDGAIVECGVDGSCIPPEAFGEMPVVYLNTVETRRGEHGGHVVCDQASFAHQAARELLESGFGDYAYVPAAENTTVPWNVARGAAFEAEMSKAGKRFHRLPLPAGPMARRDLETLVVPWLAALPKPVGIFGANDWSAKMVLEACERLGLAVPEEVAVVGVDNSLYICGNTTPTLTSIPQNFEGEGATATGLLMEMMEAPGRVFPPRKCAAARLVRRGSTHFDPWRDERVARGLEFIRQGACGGIGPADVARAMCASRTLADASFRKATGHTILDEIHAVRLRTAQDMLARGVQPDIVAQSCGYSSTNDFRRVFRQRLGTTIRQWMKEVVPTV